MDLEEQEKVFSNIRVKKKLVLQAKLLLSKDGKIMTNEYMLECIFKLAFEQLENQRIINDK